MSRTVVVSGGGTGIGRAVARRFTESGDTVWIVGRRREVLDAAAAELHPAVRACQADLREPSAVEQLVTRLPARVDVVVANAGGLAAHGDGRGLAAHGDGRGLAAVAAGWLASWQANVLTAVLLVEGLRPALARPGGRVVLLSSIAAQRGGGSYGAAKAALHGWAFALAAELGPDGVTVNVVAPGFVEDTEFFGGRLSEQRRRTLVGQTLLGRAGRPRDIAEAVYAIASPAGSWMTGQVIAVNGGAALGR